MRSFSRYLTTYLVMLALGLSSCAHQIAFHDAHYNIQSQKHSASIVAVIEHHTLDHMVSVRSFMTGIAHVWNAQPGQMLKQVADIELPQMFDHYDFASDYKEPNIGDRRLTLIMTIPSYTFADFHASITVHAIAYGQGKNFLFDKTYTEQGAPQGAKMFWARAFGMKSAVRQSSLDAYKKIFAAMRGDLTGALLSLSRQQGATPDRLK